MADDPEGAGALVAVTNAWRALPSEVRPRVHLAALLIADIEQRLVAARNSGGPG